VGGRDEREACDGPGALGPREQGGEGGGGEDPRGDRGEESGVERVVGAHVRTHDCRERRGGNFAREVRGTGSGGAEQLEVAHPAPGVRREHLPICPLLHVIRCRVEGSRFRVSGSGIRDLGLGFRVSGSGCRVQGSGCRV